MQHYVCEYEECDLDISEEGKRHRCMGCGRWFCLEHTGLFMQTGERVCKQCWVVWGNLSYLRFLDPWINYTNKVNYHRALPF
jgi:hypothetical protein